MGELLIAEIPCIKDTELQEQVLKYSIQIPCGFFDSPSAVCLPDGTCQEYFPKQFVNETYNIERSYDITYHLRCPTADGEQVNRPAGIVFLMQAQAMNSSWFIPYNSTLARMLARQCNAVFCTTGVGGIRNVVKYVVSCHDRVTLEFIF